MAEVLDGHFLLGHDSCSCNEMFYDTRMAGLEIAHEHSMHVEERLSAAGFGPVAEATKLIRDLTDSEDCHFDHHGGCQAHGYLGLKPGEMCPQMEAKAWAHNHGSETCAAWWQYEVGEGAPPVAYPCPTTKALASIYKDHPDYQQEWSA